MTQQLALFNEPVESLGVPALDVPPLGLALIESMPEGTPARETWLYLITDQEQSVGYIGKTAQGLAERLAQHKRESQIKDSRLYAWWRSLTSQPVMVPLFACGSDLEARCAETAIIWLCRAAGLELLNTGKGGEGKAAEEQGRCREHGEYAPGRGCPECRRGSDRFRYPKRANRKLVMEIKRQREQYATDPAWAERVRERVRERCRVKYATDPAYRERQRAKARERQRARRASRKAAQPVA